MDFVQTAPSGTRGARGFGTPGRYQFRLRELGHRDCTAHLTASTTLYLVWKSLEVREGWPPYDSRHSGSGVRVGWIWMPCRHQGLTTSAVKIDAARLTARVMYYFGFSIADIFQTVSFLYLYTWTREKMLKFTIYSTAEIESLDEGNGRNDGYHIWS